MHKSQSNLQKQLEQAAQKVNVGNVYWHYKNPNDDYKVLNLAITEWNDEICVIYQAQYGENLIFVRPLESWLTKAEWKGKRVPRFTQKK